jgi:hypothetical protein
MPIRCPLLSLWEPHHKCIDEGGHFFITAEETESGLRPCESLSPVSVHMSLTLSMSWPCSSPTSGWQRDQSPWARGHELEVEFRCGHDGQAGIVLRGNCGQCARGTK